MWWISYYLGGRQVRRSLKTTNKVVAQKALADISARLTRKELGLVTDIGVEEFLAEYLEYSRARKAANTYDRDRDILGNFSRFLGMAGIIRLSEIDTKCLEDYMAWRRQTVKAISVNRELITIRHTQTMAKQWGYIQDAVKVKKFRVPETSEYRFLSFEEIALLLEHSRGHHLYGILATAYYAGLRLSELINLTWEDVRFAEGYILVRNKADFTTKSLRNRSVPFSQKLRAILLPLAAEPLAMRTLTISV